MDSHLIKKHNEVVGTDDTVVHAGDFCLKKNRKIAESYIKQLHGNHIFIRGSHDYWMSKKNIDIDTGPIIDIWEKNLPLDGENQYIVVCHYAMREWPRSFHGSIQLYGHSHGSLPPVGRQMDVGVDTNNFYPYSLNDVITVMNKVKKS
jgi:calcineurin-like phosphoesterase family protein